MAEGFGAPPSVEAELALEAARQRDAERLQRVREFVGQGPRVAPPQTSMGPAHAPPPVHLNPAIQQQQMEQAEKSLAAEPMAPRPPQRDPVPLSTIQDLNDPSVEAGIGAYRQAAGLPPQPQPQQPPGAPASRRPDPLQGLPDRLRPGYGGLYYPEDYEEQLEAWVQEVDPDSEESLRRTIVQAEALEAKRENESGPLGRQTAAERRQLQGAQERYKVGQRVRGVEAELDERAQFGRGIARLHEERINERIQDIRKAKTQAAKKYMSEIRGLEKDIQETRIDPDRLWSGTKGGAGKAIALVGVALAEFGRVLTGGQRNVALEIMQKAVDRDVDAQKANLMKKERMVQSKRSTYAQAMERFGDEELAEALHKRELWRNMRTYAEQLQGQMRGEQRKAQVDLAVSQMREAEEVYDLKVQQRAATIEQQMKLRAMKAAASRPQNAPAGPVIVGDPKELGVDPNLYMPEEGGFASTPEEKKKLAAARAFEQQVIDASRAVEEIVRDASWVDLKNPLSEVNAKLDGIKTRITTAESQAAGAGVIREYEEGEWSNVFPSGTEIVKTRDQVMGSLRTARGMANSKAEAIRKNANVTPGGLRRYVDEDGKPRADVYVVQPSEEQTKTRQQRALQAADRAPRRPVQ